MWILGDFEGVVMVIERRYGALKYYQFEHFGRLKHGMFTRLGGVSAGAWHGLNLGGTVGDSVEAVRQNHLLMYEAMDVDIHNTCTTWLAHGADTVIVDTPVRNRRWVAIADGMVTDRPNLALVMRYADCTPLLFHDPVRHVIGIGHAGWRGTVLGIGASIIRTMMTAYGCRPEDIRAGIGACIGPDKYQVGDEVVAAVQDYFGTTDGLIKYDSSDNTAYLNLWEANKRDLIRMGLVHIEIAGICTATRLDEFYSHRAEKGRTGRFGVVMSL
jgi:YfiH family protein